MAELVEGVQYGLSSQGNNSDKSLIFVKLTDSAYRAIESYLKDQSKFTRSPTIQFLGNEGTLTFPSCESSHGQAGFKFSLSTNSDIEGPQGSFECVKQNSSTSLEPLGALPCKMRIHAKDDVYDRTRDQLAKAEENQKRNCTREIKPGGPGIGKKVKLKVRGIPARSTGNTVPSVQKEKDLPVLNTRQPPATKPFPSNVKPSTNGYLPAHNSMSSGGSPQNSIRTKPSGNTGGQKIVNTDIMRRPLRERLIHLLAVRPYKKPEVYERLRKDGIIERDRKLVGDVLKQIAFMRENTFQLNRNIWNDVQEDWPFYTEQDRQMLKRRKPQNLTPPGSSDGGSSGSGHSPTSTHPGSPPPPVSSNLKRPGYFEGADGLPSKKQRVSHYRKPDQQLPCTRTASSNNNSGGGAAVGLPSLLDGPRRVNTPEHDEEENRDRRPYGERDNLSSDRRPFSEREGGSSDRRFSDRDSASSDRRSLAERNSTLGERRPLSGENVLDRRPLAMETECGSSDRRYCGPDRGSVSVTDKERRQFTSDNVSDSVFSAVNNKEMSSTNVHSDTIEHSAVQCFNQSPNTSSPGRSSGLNGSNKTLREESVWGKTESGRVPSPSTSARNSGRYQDSRNDRWNGNCNNSSSFSRNAGNGNYNGVTNNSSSSSSSSGGSSSSNRSTGNNISNRSNTSNNFSHSNSNSDQRNGYSSSHVPSSSNAVNIPVAAAADTYSSPHCQQESVDQPLNGELPFADYLSNYTKIMNSEQRSKYKADFNADYSEYRRLHSEVEKVSQRFAHLEKSLNQQVKFSSGWKSIQKQIIREYEENKRDQRLQDVKKRFQYLHEKLSHIKRLVSEYDAAQNCN